jgi:hypothetical protein
MILLVLVMTLVFLVGAIVIDLGLWLNERRGVARAADLAGLAGALDLPADPAAARANALEWAKRNGYENGVDGVTVEVELLCSNDIINPPSGICENPNPPNPSPCVPEVACDSLRVIIHKPAPRLFTPIFAGEDVIAGFGAAAGLDFDLIPVDTAVMVDATGSMGANPPCNNNQNNAGCPILEAKNAAGDFADILLAGNNTRRQVGYAPYRGCYRPPVTNSACVSATSIIGLTTNSTVVQAGISSTTAVGGTGTNVCLALHAARQILEGPGAQTDPATERFVVILTDGDNTYNAASFGGGAPPTECRPNNANQSDPNTGTGCLDAQTRERELDVKTRVMADDLRSNGREIYVVGFGVCGSASNQIPTNAYCTGIGNNNHDNTADRRLLKCIASSSPGTNDHYFEVPHASDLPEVFELIAYQIANRALVE